MNSVFILVFKRIDNERRMSKFNKNEDVIKAIGQMENCEVEKVFEVTWGGTVIHYNIVFKGKLKLERVE